MQNSSHIWAIQWPLPNNSTKDTFRRVWYFKRRKLVYEAAKANIPFNANMPVSCERHDSNWPWSRRFIPSSFPCNKNEEKSVIGHVMNEPCLYFF